MQISFQQTNMPGVYETHTGLDAVNLKQSLDREPGWRDQGGYGRWQVYSLYEHEASDQHLQTTMAWFRTKQAKKQLIDLAVNDPVFCDQWSNPDADSLDRLTESYGYCVRTPAHFEDHPWHVDARNLMLQGMIYLVDHEYADQGTWFCRDYRALNDSDGCDILKLEAKPAQGWILVNSDRSFHRGLNYTGSDRFCIKFGLQLLINSRNAN
jgi:hypothetical protein